MVHHHPCIWYYFSFSNNPSGIIISTVNSHTSSNHLDSYTYRLFSVVTYGSVTIYLCELDYLWYQPLLDPYSLPRARRSRQRPKSSRQLPRGSRQKALGKEFFAESHVAGSRQRLCRRPEMLSAKPTALSRNVNVDVVFAESRADKLSAKTIYFFLKNVFAESPSGWLSTKGVFAESHTGRRSTKTFYVLVTQFLNTFQNLALI